MFDSVPGFFSAVGTALDGSVMQSGALWALRNIPGFPPVIQTVHILGIALVMATLVLMNLRILGLAAGQQSTGELSARVRPLFWLALSSNFVSGAFFVFGRPLRYFNNPVFAWKMALLLPVLLLAVLYWHFDKREPGYWRGTGSRVITSRLMALVSLCLILLVATAGRWIAYLEYIQYPLWSYEPYFGGEEFTFWVGVENWSLSQIIAATNWFPTLETIHVIAATLMLGSIFWVDLRLLGMAATSYPVSVLSRAHIPWTWGCFAVAVFSGLGMFITRASSHIENPAFIWKAALLGAAGLNMAYFHFRTDRQRIHWDTSIKMPVSTRLAGALSLLFWSGVMLAGRWIGHIV